MAVANDPYTLTVPQDTRKLSIRSRLGGTVKMALSEAELATNYVTIPPNGASWSENLYLKQQVLHFSSDQTTDTLEVLIYKD